VWRAEDWAASVEREVVRSVLLGGGGVSGFVGMVCGGVEGGGEGSGGGMRRGVKRLRGGKGERTSC